MRKDADIPRWVKRICTLCCLKLPDDQIFAITKYNTVITTYKSKRIVYCEPCAKAIARVRLERLASESIKSLDAL